MNETLNETPKGVVMNSETHDLTEVRTILTGLIKGMNEGPRSRARSLVITKLEEAKLWAGEALFGE